jgi:hypothetical protein
LGQLKNSVVHISLAMPANIRNPADRFKPFSPPPLMTYYRGFIKSVPPSQSTDGAMAEIGEARVLVSCRTPRRWAIARSLPLPVRSVSLIAAKRGSIIRFGHKNMSMIRKSGNRFFLATNAWRLRGERNAIMIRFI